MSLYSHISKFTIQLNLATNSNYSFNKEFKPTQDPKEEKVSKQEVLKNMLSILEKAPVYYLAATPVINFNLACSKYITPEKNIKKDPVKKTAKKIETLLNKVAKTILICFQNKPAEMINKILDKEAKNIDENEYNLLVDLSNFLAYNRLGATFFYYITAINEKVQELHKPCPNIKIILEPPNWRYYFDAKVPDNFFDLHLLLLIKFHGENHSKNLFEDFEFLKKIIERKHESTDIEFKKFLVELIYFYQIYSITKQIDQLPEALSPISNFSLKLKKLYEQVGGMKTEKEKFGQYSFAFIMEPPSFVKEKASMDKIHLFYSTAGNYEEVAREHFKDASIPHEEFNIWYAAIYDKIQEVQKIKTSTHLPSLSKEDFNKGIKFISKKQIKIPILSLIEKLEKEASELIQIRENTQKTQSKQTEDSLKEKDPTLSPSDNNKILTISSSTAMDSSSQQPSSLSIEEKVQEPVLLDTSEIKEKTIHELLQETSPFCVKKRITNWFDPNQKKPIINHESVLLHNFAWAANDIAWIYGLRYSHETDQGKSEPALAMLCQVEHYLYNKPELFRLTVTFDHELKNNQDSKKIFNSSLKCYHRTLTQTVQKEKIMEDFIKLGKDRFIDFPSLPSQCLQINFPENLLHKQYHDGSFIESVNGSMITIRDPKNDRKKLCRLNFFVVQ